MTMPKTDDVNTAIPQTREEILRVFSSHMKEMAEFGVEGASPGPDLSFILYGEL